MVTRFEGEHGDLPRVRAVRVEARRENGVRTFIPTAEAEVGLDADLVLIAIGYEGATRSALLDELLGDVRRRRATSPSTMRSRARQPVCSRPATRFEVRR